MGNIEYSDVRSLVQDSSGSIGYICDMETHEVMYLSAACMRACGLSDPDEYRHQKCYKLLQGEDEPCRFCECRRFSEESDTSMEHCNEKMGKWFYLTDNLISMGGHVRRIRIARDISARKQGDGMGAGQLMLEDALFTCLNTLNGEPDPARAFNRFLNIVGEYYRANRAYIIEFDLDTQLADNTFEWCAQGVVPAIDFLKDIPISVMDHWIERFRTVGEFSISSIVSDLAPDSEDRRILEAQNIESLLAAPLRRGGEIVGFVGVDDPRVHIRDLTLLKAVSGFVLEELEKRRLLSALEERKHTDALTGLGNRNRYIEVLSGMEVRPPKTLGIIALDINGMRETNDTYGFDYGDRVIKNVARKLRSQFPKGVYRIGGDEFMVLCADVGKPEFQDGVVALQRAFDEDKSCKVSIGFAWRADEHSVDANALRLQAHEMRRAEKQSYYHTVLNAGSAEARAGFVCEVLDEIEKGRFVVHYQPQVNIRTGEVIGAEALVRKLADDGGLIPPGKFIQYYEVAGVISHVDLFVLRTACAALRKWMDDGYRLQMSVNFSRVTLLEPYIVDVISGIAAENGIPPQAITIEVTESIGKMDGEYLKKLVDQLRAVGFSISLDDFGSQYSNLAMLACMDFDEIKFDRSLVSALEHNEKSRVVMKNGLGLCRELNSTTSLAEGIETQGQLELLASYDCDYGQGYYFSRPVSTEQFGGYLMTHRH